MLIAHVVETGVELFSSGHAVISALCTCPAGRALGAYSFGIQGAAGCAHLVNKHGAKVADDVDDAKDEAPLGEHGQVGASQVAIHREHVRHLVQVLPHLQAGRIISEAAIPSSPRDTNVQVRTVQKPCKAPSFSGERSDCLRCTRAALANIRNSTCLGFVHACRVASPLHRASREQVSHEGPN